MIKNKFLFLLFLVSVLVIAGCQDAVGIRSNPSSDIIPESENPKCSDYTGAYGQAACAQDKNCEWKDNKCGDIIKTVQLSESKNVDLGSSYVDDLIDTTQVRQAKLSADNNVKVMTSLTASEDDYQTDVVMEVGRNGIKYIIDSMDGRNGITRSDYDRIGTETYNLMGRTFTIDSRMRDSSSSRSNTISYGGQMTVIRNGVREVVNNGDAFWGEDINDPDWVWNIDGWWTSTAGPKFGIENDFIYNDDSDNPPRLGECVQLPNEYGRVCLDGLSNDEDYNTFTIEYIGGGFYDGGVDLREAGGSQWEKVTKISSPTGNIKLGRDEINANEVYIDSGNGVYYKNINRGTVEKLTSKINSDYGNYQAFGKLNNDVYLIALNFVSKGGQNLFISTPLDLISINSRGGINGGLGERKGLEESREVMWDYKLDQVGDSLIGTKDEDHRTAYGVIIKNPKFNGASDKVVLEIPKAQVEASLSLNIGGGRSVPTSSKTVSLKVGEFEDIGDTRVYCSA